MTLSSLLFVHFLDLIHSLGFKILIGTCNVLDPPLPDIVLFGLFLSCLPSRLYNESSMERFPHLIKGDLFSSPTNVEHHSTTLILSIRH